MPEDDELARRVRKLVIEHAETRWLALRVGTDIQDIREDIREVKVVQREHSARFNALDDRLDEHTRVLNEHGRMRDEHGLILQEHTARFDSVDAQLRSLTLMVGQVLERFPEDPPAA